MGDMQLPELSKLLAIVDGKILAQSQANAKAWAAADSGIQTNLDTYKQAQLTELQSVRNDIKATAKNAAAAVDVVQKNLNTVARNLGNDVTLAEQQITATRKALEQRINRVTRDKDVGCKPGTYLVADTTDSKVDTCVSCPAGYYCTGGKANKRKLSHGGNCASVNTHGRTLTASPHLTADCKSSVVASSSSFDNSNVKRCDRDIQCKYSTRTVLRKTTWARAAPTIATGGALAVVGGALVAAGVRAAGGAGSPEPSPSMLTFCTEPAEGHGP